MCRKVQCDDCKKPTWSGCGFHVEQALKGVPEEDRCKCEKTRCQVIHMRK